MGRAYRRLTSSATAKREFDTVLGRHRGSQTAQAQRDRAELITEQQAQALRHQDELDELIQRVVGGLPLTVKFAWPQVRKFVEVLVEAYEVGAQLVGNPEHDTYVAVIKELGERNPLLLSTVAVESAPSWPGLTDIAAEALTEIVNLTV
jgi:hypothetical protein